MSFLWRLCVSGQLVYSHHSTVELPCMERRRASSYPGGSSLVDIHWQPSGGLSPKTWTCLWTQKHIGPVQLETVFRRKLWCCFHPVSVCVSASLGYSAMLQQSELIFDFASDHINMSQVSKCCVFVCGETAVMQYKFQSNVRINCELIRSNLMCVLKQSCNTNVNLM